MNVEYEQTSLNVDPIHYTELFAVIDQKARSVVAIFSAINEQVAIRSFEDLIFRVEDNVYNQHPEDFVLQGGLRFGVDQKSGLTITSGSLQVIASGSSYSRALIDSRRLQRASYYKTLESIKSGSNIDSKD